MARATRATAPTVNLFPFLAVLLCMMGALVFLLIALSSRVGVDPSEVVIATAPIVSLEPVEPIEPEIIRPTLRLPDPVIHDAEVIGATLTQDDVDGPLLKRIAELERLLAERKSVRIEREAMADSAAEESARLSAELAALKTQLSRLAEQRRLAAKKLSDSETLVDQAVAKLAKLNDDLAEKAQQPRARQTKFRLLPYDRTTGTQRHPIVVECVEDGYRFAIEGLDIPAKSFRGQTIESNPLIDGVNALAAFYSRRGERPYVLLVVRPEGIESFQIARGILQRNRRDWGYELIPENVDLDWPITTPGAYDELLAAITRPSSPRGIPLHESGDVFGYANRMTSADRSKASQLTASRRSVTTPGTNRGPAPANADFAAIAAQRRSGMFQNPGASNGTADAQPRQQDIFASLAPPVDAAAAGSPNANAGTPAPGQPPAALSSRGAPGGKPIRRWGKQSPDQWIGFERRVEVDVTGSTLRWQEATIDDINSMPIETLSVAIADFLDIVSADWEPPRRNMHWRPTLVAQGTSLSVDSRIKAACEEIDVSFKREAPKSTAPTRTAPTRTATGPTRPTSPRRFR